MMGTKMAARKPSGQAFAARVTALATKITRLRPWPAKNTYCSAQKHVKNAWHAGAATAEARETESTNLGGRLEDEMAPLVEAGEEPSEGVEGPSEVFGHPAGPVAEEDGSDGRTTEDADDMEDERSQPPATAFSVRTEVHNGAHGAATPQRVQEHEQEGAGHARNVPSEQSTDVIKHFCDDGSHLLSTNTNNERRDDHSLTQKDAVLIICFVQHTSIIEMAY